MKRQHQHVNKVYGIEMILNFLSNIIFNQILVQKIMFNYLNLRFKNEISSLANNKHRVCGL